MCLRDKIIYQIYPKSFKDSNGDGFGDLNGIIEKLDYIKDLGVNYIWITPFYKSPQKDNGYDISDYYSIDPIYGCMDDFDKLIEEAKKRNIDIMLDMVFNHTSTEHEWFKKALKGDSKYKDFYIFKKGIKNEKPPTNWQSKFGGSAWEYVEKLDEYYLHLFDVTQADLNWDNEEVRKEIYKVVNFWIDKGVKGFRFDVINLISKPEYFEDDLEGDGRKYYTDGPNIHKYIKELNRETFGKYRDIITVGEMSSTNIENCLKYSNPKENELSMVFNFHHLKVDYKDGDKWGIKKVELKELKDIFSTWQEKIIEGKGCLALFWCNHDQQRINSRFCDVVDYRKESSKMLANLIHLMNGVPYIYQGEEIGMTNPNFNNIEEYRDVESLNFYNEKLNEGIKEEEILEILKNRSRDNSRTIMQWDDKNNCSFTSGTPWINHGKSKEINVKKEINDRDSIYFYYKKLIELRKSEKVIRDGDFKILLEDSEKIFSYKRELKNEAIISINNFSNEEVVVDINALLGNYSLCKVLISNYEVSDIKSCSYKMRPYEAIGIKIIR
ncbi:MAG: alpha,alpha-phosphotrehalase [Clostridium sp.]|uniref:alpha,alpha-phosphotrehalase n=1 Tax=Clostridium sp. TaxID=1506 RepID=UPI003EE4B09A